MQSDFVALRQKVLIGKPIIVKVSEGATPIKEKLILFF